MLFLCTAILCCAFIAPKNAYALKSDNNLVIGELTRDGYNSSSGAVFDRNALNSLYSALTGGKGNTLQSVANTVSGTRSDSYGNAVKVNLPEYKTAADLYALNGNKNIVVNLGGQEFAVSFLTTDMNGDVIATLWMTQPLKDASGTVLTDKFGWATSTYSTDYTTSIGESYISDAYSTSLLRMKLLNAGLTNGSDTAYAMGTSNANATSLNQTVTTAERKSNVLAPFTLENTALSGTDYAGKSLIDFLTTPSQVKYTYYLDWPYASGNAASVYMINDALSKDANGNFTVSTDVGTTHTDFYTQGRGAYRGCWWNSGIYNYANSTVNHYNDWGADYVWLPSLSETGHTSVDGLWVTGGTITGQINFNNESTSGGSLISGSTTSSEFIWLRSGEEVSAFHSLYLSSRGNCYYAFTAASLAVRPALHFNLTAAEAACSVNIPKGVETTYNAEDWSSVNKFSDLNISWYNTKFIDLTFPAGGMIDAKNYTVTANLSQTAIDREMPWSDQTTASKTFTFTINKKPLAVKFETDDVGFPVASFANKNEIYARDGSEGDSTYPKLGLVYYKKGANASTATSTPPNSTGNWIARAVVTNDCNYTTDPETYEFEWEVTLYPVAQPIFTSTGTTTLEKPYNGEEQTITIDGVDTTKMTYLADGNEVSSTLSGTTLTIVVKSAKDYEVKFTLRTDGDLPYKWAGIADGAAATGQLTLTVKITKVAATVNYDNPVDNADPSKIYSDWSWGINTPVKININGAGLGGDSIALKVSYVRGEATSSDGGVALSLVNGSYLVPSIANLGTYTLCIELASSGGDNANYTFAGKYISFKLTGQGVDFDSVNWLYKTDGTGTGTAITGTAENNVTTVSLPYTGKEYSFFINEDVLPTGLAIKSTGGDRVATAVGTYTTTVTIYSTTEAVDYAETVFTLKYEITKGDYDINFVWVYKYTGETNYTAYTEKTPEFKNLSVTLSLMQYVNGVVVELPAELSVKLSGNTGREIGPYTAKATITTSNGNFNAPTVADFPWEITEKVINVVWTDDYVYDGDGNEYYTRVLLVDDPAFADQVEYYYSYNGTQYGEGADALKELYELAGNTQILTVTVEVRLKAEAEGSYRLVDASGNECREEFDIGDNKIPAAVSVEVSGCYSNLTLNLTVSGSGMSSAYYTVEYYKAESLTSLGEKVENFAPNTADAGTYVAVVTLVAPWDEEYILRPSRVLFEIAPMEIAIPEVGEITFNGNTLDLKDNLGGSYADFAQYIEIIGTSGRDAGDYTAYLTLTTKNYIWAMPEDSGAAATKRAVRATLTSEGISVSVDRSMLTLPWKINKAQLTANWNLSGKEGAALNALSAYKDAINEGLIDVELILRYYDNDKNLLETVEFAGGKSYLVDAILSGEDAKNFEFVNGVGTDKSATAMVEYTVPQSGVAAALGKVGEFMTGTLWGLPVWAWFAIGLAVLILLIIIIAVACKRRKSKEEREEIKARKEEEKARREEERRLQQERLEAERELARAKQEAELEKIRAQAGMAAGAGMASMAMQQAQQQPVQQPQPQPQPVQQQTPQTVQQQPVMTAPAQITGDVAMALAKIEAELAQLRANQNAPQGGYAPAAGGMDYHSVYAEERARAAEAKLLEERVRIEERARAAEQRAMLAEERYWRGGLQGSGNAIPAEVVVALLQAVNNGGNAAPVNITAVPAPAPAAIPQSVEESTQSSHAQYPSDAVITTTTTVDTTQKQQTARRNERGANSEFIDVDGFYDEI